MPATTTILLVDDEVTIAAMVGDALTDEGFAVVIANDGAEALDLIAANPSIDALVTDIDMEPGTDGWDVARCARAACPKLPVVYTTGGAAHEWAQNGVDGSVLVTKPFPTAAIVDAVTHVLAKAAATY